MWGSEQVDLTANWRAGIKGVRLRGGGADDTVSKGETRFKIGSLISTASIKSVRTVHPRAQGRKGH